MMYTAFLALLTDEHWRRFGGPPEDADWLWQPWVGEFLRSYDPPGQRQEMPHEP